MVFDFTINFLKCQACHAKVNCDKCEKEILAYLAPETDIKVSAIDMNAKTISIETDLDRDDAIDILEDIGCFAS